MKHYAPWVRKLQAALDDAMKEVWVDLENASTEKADAAVREQGMQRPRPISPEISQKNRRRNILNRL
jgi:hypothetical protein